MRPIRFWNPYASRGVTIGASIAKGLENAVMNYQKVQNANALQKYHQMQAQAMQSYRDAQAEAIRQKSMGADMVKLQMLRSAGQSGNFDPSLVRKFEGQYMEKVLSAMKPEEAAAAKARFDQEAAKGQISSEFQSYANLNPNEARLYSNQSNNEAKMYSAETAANARVESSRTIQAGLTARTKDYNDRMRERTIQMGYGQIPADKKVALEEQKNINDHMATIAKNIQALSKPEDTTPGKETLLQNYQQDLASLHQRSMELGGIISGTKTPGSASNPGQSAPQPKEYSWNDRKSAQVGDFVTAPNGQRLKVEKIDQTGLSFSKPDQAAATPAPARAGTPSTPQAGPAPAAAPNPAPAPSAQAQEDAIAPPPGMGSYLTPLVGGDQ